MMKKKYYFLFLVLFLASFIQAQSQEFKLKNALVIAQQDDLSDRYSLEVAILQLLNSYGIQTKASLNVFKQGGSADVLLTDSLQTALKHEGIDTYMLISVRGYDKRFKPTENIKSLEEEIQAGHLFSLYRESATSVSFSITFYKNGKPVHYELIKTGTVGSQDAVIKKLLRKMERSLKKDWI
jgi:hypothetical protein